MGYSFCWTDETDTLYSNYTGSIATLQVVVFATVMLVDLSVAIIIVTISVAIIQL